MQRTVTKNQIDFYRENGYLQILNVLSPRQLQDLRTAFDRLDRVSLDGNFDPAAANEEHKKLFVQKINLWRVSPQIRRHVFNRRLGEIARRLMGTDEARVWHDQALIKMPGDSKESPWHQDQPYWPMDRDGAVSCWMALDDVDETNGCMAFVPKSHTWGAFPPVNLFDESSLFDKAREKLGEVDLTPVQMRMPAGSCTFHHGLLFHYAHPNRSPRPRRAMVTIYMGGDTRFNGNEHVITGGQGFEIGEPLAGDLFPVVASKK